jgi:hypothetical protein
MSIEDTGIDFAQHVDLCLKTFRFGGRLAGGEAARRLRVPYRVFEEVLTFLKREKLLETVGSQGIVEQQYEYALTEKGYEKATEALERNQYVGALPVPLAEYVALVKEQTIRKVAIKPAQVAAALSDLELSQAYAGSSALP